MMDVQIDRRSERLLMEALKAAERKTTLTTGKLQAKAMHQICRSAGAGVKPKSMNAKRELVNNPARTGRGRNAKGARYAIKVLRQGSPSVLVPTNTKTDQRRKIRKLGLARSAFRIASGAFGAAITGQTVKTRSKLVDTVNLQKGRQVKMRVEVFLSYIEKAFPSVVPMSIKKGLTVFIRSFDREWATALKDAKWA